MAKADIYEDLTELVSCPVCLEEFSKKSPRQLTCLHVICEECIHSLLDKREASNPEDRGIIECPTCRCSTAVPEGCPARLPHYFQYTQIEDIRKRVQERHVICGICNTDTHSSPISYYCFQCIGGICKECHVKHDKIYSRHTAIPVTPSTVNNLICSGHDIHMEHFCVTCSRAVCSKCYIAVHSDHKVYDLTFDGKATGDDLKSLLLSSLKETEAAIFRLEALEKEVKQSRELLEEGKMKITELINETNNWAEPVKDIPQAQILNIEELTLEVRRQIPSTDVKINISPEMISSTVSTQTEVEQQQPVTSETQDTVFAGRRRNATFAWQTPDIGLVISGIDFINNNLIVLAENKVLMFNEDGQQISHYLCNYYRAGTKWLSAVCVNKTGSEVSILTNSSTDIHRCNGNKWKTQRFDLICKNPVCITTTEYDNLVIGGDDTWLYKFNKSLSKIWSHDMSSPICAVKIVHDGKIIVCVKDNVLVCHKNGYILSSLGSYNYKGDPGGVCFWPNHEMLVSNQVTNYIEAYNTSGPYIGTVVNLGWKPYQLALCINRHLAVSDGYDVFVYKL